MDIINLLITIIVVIILVIVIFWLLHHMGGFFIAPLGMTTHNVVSYDLSQNSWFSLRAPTTFST